MARAIVSCMQAVPFVAHLAARNLVCCVNALQFAVEVLHLSLSTEIAGILTTH